MRLRAILREAGLDLASGAARAILFGLALVALVGAFETIDLVQVRSLDAEARAFDEKGASTLTLSAPGRIDPTLCEALAGQPGVRGAGALRQSRDSTLAVLPSSSIPTFEVSPGLPRILGVHSRGSGVVLSAELAAQLGRGDRSRLVLAGRSIPVAGVYDYPDDGRARGYGYALMLPTRATTPFDECWVRQWPQSDGMEQLLRGTLVPGSATGAASGEVRLSQLNITLGSAFEGTDLLASRLSRWAFVAVAVGAFGLGAISVRLRRLALAAELHLGLSRRALHAIHALEVGAWTAPALVTGSLIGCVIAATAEPADAPAYLLLAVAWTLTGVVGAGAGALAGLWSVRERHLFRYFKDRA